MVLSDLGAEVVRVDRPSDAGADPLVPTLHRGRRSVAIDLKTPEGVDLVLRLVVRADALIEGFRPGVTERLGLGPDTCLALSAGRRPADVTADLAEAYRTTTFRVLAPAGPLDLRTGQSSPDLDALLHREGVHCWAFLTAWSPGGSALPERENQRRGQALRRRLRETGVPLLPGLGIGTDPQWPAEDSVLAVGLDRLTASRIGAEFGQDAIVVGERGTAPELLWCRVRIP